MRLMTNTSRPTSFEEREKILALLRKFMAFAVPKLPSLDPDILTALAHILRNPEAPLYRELFRMETTDSSVSYCVHECGLYRQSEAELAETYTDLAGHFLDLRGVKYLIDAFRTEAISLPDWRLLLEISQVAKRPFYFIDLIIIPRSAFVYPTTKNRI